MFYLAERNYAFMVLFYGFGAYFGTRKKSFEGKILKVLAIYLLLFLWITILIIKSFWDMHFEPMDYYGNTEIINRVMHYIAIMIGIIVVWCGYDLYFDTREWGISKYSFLIYVAHEPLVETIRKVMLGVIGYDMAKSLLVYFVSAFLSIAIVIITGSILYNYFRQVWKIVTGRS